MLRSFDLLRQVATSDALIAADEGLVALKGGGGGYAMPWHWHDCLMLILPSVGALNLSAEDHKADHWVSEDRFALIPAARAHKTRAFRAPHSHLALYVTSPGLQQLEKRLGSLSEVRRRVAATSIFAATADMRALYSLCSAPAREFVGASAARGHVAMALLIQCLAAVEHGEVLQNASRHTHGVSLVSEMKTYLSAKFPDVVPLDELSARFGLSRRHVSRLFREHTGLSVGEFHAAVRIATARRLLAETDLPVGEVAYRTGFDSGAGLARTMRKLSGCSPTEFRTATSGRLARSAKP